MNARRVGGHTGSTPAADVPEPQRTIQELIERSSLGTPKEARESVPIEKAQAIVQRAKELAEQRPDLDAIRARLDEATSGPWRVEEEHGRDFTGEGYSRIDVVMPDAGRYAAFSGGDYEGVCADAQFIASAPSDISALLVRVAELEAEVDGFGDVAAALAVADDRITQLTAAVDDAHRLAAELETEREDIEGVKGDALALVNEWAEAAEQARGMCAEVEAQNARALALIDEYDDKSSAMLMRHSLRIALGGEPDGG